MTTSAKIRSGVVVGLAFGGTLFAVAYGAMLARYVVFGIKHGDWLNDWLTHLPQFVQAIALHIVRISGG